MRLTMEVDGAYTARPSEHTKNKTNDINETDKLYSDKKN